MSVGKASRYGTVQIVPLGKVSASPFQVRKRYGNLEQLAKNIEQRGLLQPILVRPVDGGFEIIHGHRRWKAVKSLGHSHITCFIKEMSDTEAILIQGSENLQRKNYNAIEEATLYKNYQEFMLKEKDQKIGFQGISDTFNTSLSNVETKLGLLDLPENVQNKIVRGDIPVRKASTLITLTRKPAYNALETKAVAGAILKSRTNRFYSEIERLAEEIEKGSKGGLRTKKGVQTAVDAIQEGKSIDEALEEAKLKESIEIAKKQAEQGKQPREIIKEIIQSQQDPQAVLDATIQLNIEVTRQLLKSGTLACPYCGKIDCLHWSCKGVAVIDGET